jgi:hypothetical protein
MWDALKNLFEAKNENQKMALKAKLHDTKMGKEECVSSYLTQVAQVKNEYGCSWRGHIGFDIW